MATAFAAVCVGFGCWSFRTEARPEYLAKARKFGAEDCLFCHTLPEGGEGWNARGQWLVNETARRKADKLDVEWLRDFKEEKPAEVVTGNDVAPPAKTYNFAKTRPNAKPPKKIGDYNGGSYSTARGEWPSYAGDLAARKYSPLDQINKTTAPKLRVAWTWEAFDNHRTVKPTAATPAANPAANNEGGEGLTPDGFKATPLMIGGRLFVRTNYSGVAAIDGATGRTIWTFDPGSAEHGRPGIYGFATRGLAYWKGGGEECLLVLTGDATLLALDPASGRLIDSFGDKGRVDLRQGLRRPLVRGTVNFSQPPIVVGDVVVIGNQCSDGPPGLVRGRLDPNWRANVPLGDVRAFDVRTGKQLWVFHTVPQAGEFGNNTWGNDSWRWMGNTNVWSFMSADEELGYVYLPVTAPTDNFWGGERPGDNLFSDSIVCLNARTGQRVWHFQMIHHDIWDYDPPCAPNLVDIVVAGRRVKALAQVTKQGFCYVLDRVTGKPVWPIEERAVPQSTLPGEATAKTQPIPTKPPAFEMQGVGENDLLDFTPALKARAREAIKPYGFATLYTPMNETGTILMPGWGGGANWGGASFDPETGYLYVASRRAPIILGMNKIDREKYGYSFMREFKNASVGGLPFYKPPYGSITAYDLNAGEIAWQVPNGEGPRNHPLLKNLNLPFLGNAQAPGMLVTKTLLFCADRGAGRPGVAHPVLRAYDKNTGEIVWEHPIEPAYYDAAPMTYQWRGKQYIVIATGGQLLPAKLTAFSLP
jgi:quinoprotein glucose dehydrogenase